MRKFLTKRRLVILGVVMLVVGGWWWRGQAARKRMAQEIKVVEVERKDVVRELTVTGKVEARKKATLNFPGLGKLGFVQVDEGERVKKGAWLMGLDVGDLKAAETKAWYAYLTADANAKEVEDQVKGHDKDETFGQKNDRVAAQTARDSAWENVLVAQRAVGNAMLKAPFDGVVTGVTTETLGDTVGAADGVTVVEPASLYFEVEIDEADVGKVKLGQKVMVTLDAYEGEEFEGTLTDIGFVAQTASTGATVFAARVGFSEEVLPRLRLGMNGDAGIELGRAEGVLAVPIEAVVDGQVELVGGKKVKVGVGLEGETEVEIKLGLKEGDKIVVR